MSKFLSATKFAKSAARMVALVGLAAVTGSPATAGESDSLKVDLRERTLTMASGRTAGLTPERLRAMVDAYWAARGLDGHGRVRDVASTP